ncbi:VCBS repeat-containing protein [Mucilaginibacter pallidiroseus]|uniref:VCBS repeat-containing protein n=1 Tax=Mucilaginibacter pallidiroseus TaxID=2599295 RepID=A0A563U3B0_9SPHI|nr:VCBS repeat-containing protein [Mucilaginibacter pallidiroseus]TWR25839.1 VCBS repeat-containing protein [Mucilaginibacter pallidiroseus]
MKLNKRLLYTGCILSSVSLIAIATLLDGCKSNKPGKVYKLTTDTIADGKNLAQMHCTKCHSLVPVDALTKDVWTMHALPAMAKYLSIATYGADYYKKEGDTTGLSLQEWQRIVNYYKTLAPDTLAAAKPPVPLQNDWAGFELKKSKPTSEISFTTLAAFNPANGKIYTSDVMGSDLTEWVNYKPVRTAKLPSPAVHANFGIDSAAAGQFMLSSIGRLDNVDFPNGRIVKAYAGNAGIIKTKDEYTELPRPVQTLNADFDKDGKSELVVLGQGHLHGGVYVFKTNGAGALQQFATVSDKPGAVQAVAGDFNSDGWLDIMVLYGVNDESLTLYLNNKKGGFTAKDLLRFPPVSGSTSFQLTDIDHDGQPDLIYTCGYNFRDSRILKPYHGMYIYKNTGNFDFKQSWFYPINGCTKAIAADFDRDGDIDIASIAFFADMKNKPAEEFIYFEQNAAMKFTPHAIPVSQYGRWMTLDVNDVNKDGKPDIILGNYASGFLFQPNFEPAWDEHMPFIVLQNNH